MAIQCDYYPLSNPYRNRNYLIANLPSRSVLGAMFRVLSETSKIARIRPSHCHKRTINCQLA